MMADKNEIKMCTVSNRFENMRIGKVNADFYLMWLQQIHCNHYSEDFARRIDACRVRCIAYNFHFRKWNYMELMFIAHTMRCGQFIKLVCHHW